MPRRLAVASMGWSGRTGTVGLGAGFGVTKQLSFDYELRRGVNRRATDWTHVLRANRIW